MITELLNSIQFSITLRYIPRIGTKQCKRGHVNARYAVQKISDQWTKSYHTTSIMTSRTKVPTVMPRISNWVQPLHQNPSNPTSSHFHQMPPFHIYLKHFRWNIMQFWSLERFEKIILHFVKPSATQASHISNHETQNCCIYLKHH